MDFSYNFVMNMKTNIKFDNFEIENPTFLAPMDGYTDSPFRMICKKLGAGVVISEFINGWDITNQHPFLAQKTYFSEMERPFGYQIFDDSPERMLLAALYLQEKKPDFIDINFGCSAKNVTNRGAGAGLLKHPKKIFEMVSKLVKNLNIPVSAKIRLGWDEQNLNYLEISKVIEEAGASFISVHGRTKEQGYSGNANWDAIAEIKAMRNIPIIANGDIRTPADKLKIKAVTNCDGIMIGRGALSNPWIFQNKSSGDIPVETRFNLFTEHLTAILSFYGAKTGMILFRKHLRSYIDIGKLSRPERIYLFTQTEENALIDIARYYIGHFDFKPDLNFPF